ncbi:MAG: dephospho-CoA kinase [Planctomycetaceae bacterium]|jgi:dephospho-CoA kinase|nr:dephospho-CoA kinase [Planctomycetaceae bacterium]
MCRIILGLVGGIGCGKSLVANMFAELGAKLIDADIIGHESLADNSILEQIRSYFGEHVICNVNGTNCVDRTALARIVFTQSESGLKGLKYLNSILHPRISKIITEQIQLITHDITTSPKSNENNLIVLDAPLLLETGFDKITDKIVFIESTLENRTARILKRNWTENDLKLREAAQMPIEKKQQLADFIICNNETIDMTRKQVVQLYKLIIRN